MRTRIMTLGLCALAALMSPAALQAGGTDPYGQEDPNRKVIKQGLVGAATGAVAAETSGGKAGKGALVGAGTNVIGGALLDALTTPPRQPQVVYAAAPSSDSSSQQKTERIIRKYDANGKMISEEEVWE